MSSGIFRLATPLEPVETDGTHTAALGELASFPLVDPHLIFPTLDQEYIISTTSRPVMSFRTFLPLSQPSFVEMPQLLGLPHHPKPLNKSSLEFILAEEHQATTMPVVLPSFPWTSPQRGSSNKTFAPILAPPSGPTKIAKRRCLHPASVSKGSTKPTSKHRGVLVDGTIIKKGSKYCMIEGCTSRAKHARRCWRHGGSVKCKVLDCTNRAKTKGVCWSHGGGTLCSFTGCTTISVSNGVCWAHGGGKRCVMEGCARPAYERTNHLCTLHFEENQARPAYTKQYYPC